MVTDFARQTLEDILKVMQDRIWFEGALGGKTYKLTRHDIENTPVEDICLLEVKETLFKGKTTYKV